MSYIKLTGENRDDSTELSTDVQPYNLHNYFTDQHISRSHSSQHAEMLCASMVYLAEMFEVFDSDISADCSSYFTLEPNDPSLELLGDMIVESLIGVSTVGKEQLEKFLYCFCVKSLDDPALNTLVSYIRDELKTSVAEAGISLTGVHEKISEEYPHLGPTFKAFTQEMFRSDPNDIPITEPEDFLGRLFASTVKNVWNEWSRSEKKSQDTSLENSFGRVLEGIGQALFPDTPKKPSIKPKPYSEHLLSPHDIKYQTKMERFNALVPHEYFTAKEINVLKDSFVTTQSRDITSYLRHNDVTSITLEFTSGPTDDTRGFFGALFSRQLRGHTIYAEVYKGTDALKVYDSDSVIRFAEDILQDNTQLLSTNLPEQINSARYFHSRVMAHVDYGNILYIIGFSLGNALAQLIAAEFVNDFKGMIGFDGPGMKEIIERRLPHANLPKLQSKTVLFNTRPNMINSRGTQIVPPICVETDKNIIPLRDFSNNLGRNIQIAEYTLKVHNSKSLTASFDTYGPQQIVDIKTWPSNVRELRRSFYDYELNKARWNESFQETWNKNKKKQEKFSSFEEFKAAQVKDLYGFSKIKQ